jgi:hypothetical protein
MAWGFGPDFMISRYGSGIFKKYKARVLELRMPQLSGSSLLFVPPKKYFMKVLFLKKIDIYYAK